MQLEDMRAADPTAKALVFSQFNSTIDWLKVKLEEHGFGFRTISGGMTLSKRTKVRAVRLCPASLTCALRTRLIASLFCLFCSASNQPFSFNLNFPRQSITPPQLLTLAGPLRCLWGCYSMSSPQDTPLTYKFAAGH